MASKAYYLYTVVYDAFKEKSGRGATSLTLVAGSALIFLAVAQSLCYLYFFLSASNYGEKGPTAKGSSRSKWAAGLWCLTVTAPAPHPPLALAPTSCGQERLLKPYKARPELTVPASERPPMQRPDL